MKPKRFNKGDPITHDWANDIADYIQRNTILAGSGIQVSNLPNGKLISTDKSENWFFGIITTSAGTIACNSGADFTNNRYYVQRAKLTVTEGNNACALLTFAVDDSYRSETVVATNLCESLAATHNLDAGQVVVVKRLLDDGSPPTARYYFESSGIPPGQYTGMVYQIGPDNTLVIDFVRAHRMP